MKAKEFVKLIEQVVRKVVREELKTILNESNTPLKSNNKLDFDVHTNIGLRKSLRENIIPTNKKTYSRLDEHIKGNPIKSLLNETYNQIAENSEEIDNFKLNTDDFHNLRNEFRQRIQPPKQAGSVSDMFSNATKMQSMPSPMGEEIPSPESIGEVGVVPDFSERFRVLKEKGAIK